MPTSQKVKWAQLRVGIMALVAMIILGVLIFLLTGSGDIFSREMQIRTYMSDSAGMASTSPVRLNGILIGEIRDVRLSGQSNPNRIVEIVMSIKGRFLKEIPEDSVAGISASNLLGDKFINITKGKSPKPVQDGGELKSLESQDIPELMAKSSDILTQFQVSVKRVDAMLADIQAGKGNVGKLIKDEELYARVNGVLDETQKLLAAINAGRGTVGRLMRDETLYEEVRSTTQRIDNLVAGLEQGQGTVGKLLKDAVLYEEAKKSVTEIRQLLADLNAGKGTAGKLLKDEQLHRQIAQVVTQIDRTLERINTGQGTLGQLMVNPQLYESLNGTTRELQGLLKDVRANPKKFLRIKLAIF